MQNVIAGNGDEQYNGLSDFHFAHAAGRERHTLQDKRWRETIPCDYMKLAVFDSRDPANNATFGEVLDALKDTRLVCGPCHHRTETVNQHDHGGLV